jgi:hypothetical protein
LILGPVDADQARRGAHQIIPAPFRTARSKQMLDIVMLALGFVFFALTVGYAVACDHL